jgi:hypothetical protein
MHATLAKARATLDPSPPADPSETPSAATVLAIDSGGGGGVVGSSRAGASGSVAGRDPLAPPSGTLPPAYLSTPLLAGLPGGPVSPAVAFTMVAPSAAGGGAGGAGGASGAATAVGGFALPSPALRAQPPPAIP